MIIVITVSFNRGLRGQDPVVDYAFIFCSSQADAFLLAIAGGPDLLARTQQMYFQKKKTNFKRV